MNEDTSKSTFVEPVRLEHTDMAKRYHIIDY